MKTALVPVIACLALAVASRASEPHPEAHIESSPAKEPAAPSAPVVEAPAAPDVEVAPASDAPHVEVAHADAPHADAPPAEVAQASDAAHADAPHADAAHAEAAHTGVTHAEAATEGTHAATPPSESPSHQEELASLLRIGDAKSLAQDWPSAVLAYRQLLAARPVATPAQIRAGLLGLARAYRGDRRLTQACAVYERYVKQYPDDDGLPVIYLELGRCLRALGAHRLAIARFYSVINSTLKVPKDGADTYRQLARTAQFEIAETYSLAGDHEQAGRFYSRLSLLDLSPPDRARAAFKAASSVQLAGDLEKAVTQLRAYLALYPDGEDAPEARHLLSLSLRRLGRTQESLAAVLDLLKIEQARTADPKAWGQWQRKTGNQLANEFYEQGDIATALSIYDCLNKLGGPPEWLLPVQYQIGLCQERLGQPGLARATYQKLLDAFRDSTLTESKHTALLQDLTPMVNWRLQHLDWLETIERTRPRPALPETSPAPVPDVAALVPVP